MAEKYENTDLIIETIIRKYSDARISQPDKTQTQIKFICGLAMNIYSTGSITFQGKNQGGQRHNEIIDKIKPYKII